MAFQLVTLAVRLVMVLAPRIVMNAQMAILTIETHVTDVTKAVRYALQAVPRTVMATVLTGITIEVAHVMVNIYYVDDSTDNNVELIYVNNNLHKCI